MAAAATPERRRLGGPSSVAPAMAPSEPLQCLHASKAKAKAKTAQKAKHKAAAPTALSKADVVALYARCGGVLLASVFVVLVLGAAFPVLATFHQRQRWRRFVDQVETLWFNSVFWLIPGMHMNMIGQFPDGSLRPKVVVCNHQSPVDWLFNVLPARFVSYGTVDLTGSCKILLKHEVKSIPVVGWGCSAFEFIFLRRDWAKDRPHMEACLRRLAADGQPLTFIIFPEGSTVNARQLEKSRRFAAEAEPRRPELDLLLLPRSRGFEHILSVLEDATGGDVDVFCQTMAFDGYSGEVPSWEDGYRRQRDVLIPNVASLFAGTCARTVHLESTHFSYRALRRRYPDGLQPWLDERWKRKDGLLRYFAEHKQFPNAADGILVPVTGSSWSSAIAICFYVVMFVGVAYTYGQYKAGAASGFGFAMPSTSL